MAPKPEDPVTPFFDMVGLALSGDPVMLRSLAATLGAFSMRLFVALLILAVTLWLARRLGGVAQRALTRLPHNQQPADGTLATFVSTLVKYIVVAVGLVAVLQQLGVQATSVLAVLGAASLAIGLALQGTLGNVAAGVMILLLRPYRAGDKVELAGRQGKVVGMDLFNTKLLDYDGLTLFMPNGKVFGDLIVNISQSGKRRIELVFGVDYDDDLDVALATLLEVAGDEPRVLATPAPWAKVTATGDSAVNVTLRCWSKTDDWMDTKFDLTKRIKETLEARGLSFPYPHQVTIERETKPVAKKPAARRNVGNGAARPS
ncbi:MAG: mechanosensitive ion channel family protein [Alphaproteobacteria bacterium]|nr:mechanosensitive ion channel family protein [Alphaproteobacteria bacterium]MBU1513308.1 mechanosensitive ion channel family protein [Alphaproteobacteria bacterium]MBU2095927.1 mechanosensitive ion channel family protein [Alphaproteobacteria bacterium]MBU2152147.1 mechanosensitive ion channel family protein [Alphaproteobacteria bacterium]MBU2306197.1 mechanosensitive ion channel family protein [Alphaproteobacteria bacterium]